MRIKNSFRYRILILGGLRIISGMIIYSFGVYLTIYANIGLAPWDCLGMGLAKHTPLNYGGSMVLIGADAVMHMFYSVIHFEPRALKHKSLAETIKLLSGN